MFLRNTGASGRFTFDIIYSCLQKSMRRGDYNLSIEMAKEFRDYPNALKKRLIYDCCEDCPNLYLIRDILNTPKEIDKLVPFIKIICEHIKCREVIMGFRVACQDELDTNDFLPSDDMYTWCKKLYTRLCSTDGDCTPILQHFIELYPELKDFKITQIYNAINKNRLVLYAIIAFYKIDYISQQDYTYTPINGFDFNFTPNLVLPKYVYDKHVKSSPPEQKSYKFFISNIVLNPRRPKTQLELKGEELYITTNHASGEYITKQRLTSTTQPIVKTNRKSSSMSTITSADPVKCTKLSQLKLLQTQLVTGKYKPRVWFCNDKYVLKGPITEEQYNQLELSDKLKQLFGLKTVNTRKVNIEGKLYAVFNCLYEVDYSQFVVKSSKLETDVKIYNGDIHPIKNTELETYSPVIRLQLIKNLIFRKLIGTNDTCERNFIIDPKGKFVASIDDPVLLVETPFLFKKQITNKTVKSIYTKWFEEFDEDIQIFLDTCCDKIMSSRFSSEIVDFILQQCNEFEPHL